MGSTMIYVARRKLKIGNEIREIGEQVPEAEDWPRKESWVMTGYIDRIPGEYAEVVEEPAALTVAHVNAPGTKRGPRKPKD